MANGFGGLGGLGGFSPSFPQRTGAPISNVVENLPFATQDEWLADWERRYAEEAAKANPVGTWRDTKAYMNDASMGMVGGENTVGGGMGMQSPTPTRGYPSANLVTDTPVLGGGPTVNRYQAPEPRLQDPRLVRSITSGTPDFAALEAERAQMIPRYTAQVGNQQAYDSMLGMNQLNGLPGPDYANANFGQVTGQQAQPLNAQQGIDMGWATGVYDPNYASGMFGNTGNSRNDSWL